MSFHPGQRVVCIKGRGASSRTTTGWAPKTGGVYVVRGVVDSFRGLLLHLEEYVHPETFDGVNECGWSAERFRPLDESRLDVFRAHLVTPPKQKVKALLPSS